MLHLLNLVQSPPIVKQHWLYAARLSAFSNLLKTLDFAPSTCYFSAFVGPFTRNCDHPETPLLSMAELLKTASECADCRLCPRGHQPHVVSATPDINRIVREVVRRVQTRQPTGIVVPVGISARHCHVNQEAMDILFGPGAQLTPYRDLYQPGAFAAEEVISVVGPRLRAIERVRILGPMRGYTQVELARTDAIYIGVEPPVRDSGDLRGAQQVTFIGPKGSITVNAAIRAARHIHLRPSDVIEMGLEGRETVRIRVGGEKGLLYENVRLKIDESYVPELHLDTDDANAADLSCGDVTYIEK